MAYYYNKNVRAHGGRLEGVVDLKEVPEPVWGALTRDFEIWDCGRTSGKALANGNVHRQLALRQDGFLKTTRTRKPLSSFPFSWTS